MSESGSVAKMVIFLGFVFLFIGLINPGGDSAWNTFISSTQAFPTFSNPFESGGFSANAPMQQAAFYWEYPTTSNKTDRICNNVTYFNCVTDPGGPDGNDTYVTMRNFNTSCCYGLNLAFITFGVKNVGFDWTRLTAFRAVIFCRWDTVFNNNNRTINVQIQQATGANSTNNFGASASTTCDNALTFDRADATQNGIPGAVTDANAEMQLVIFYDGNPGIGSGSLSISTITLTVYFSGNPACTGNGFFVDVSCQIAAIFRPVINLVGLIIGSFIFVGKVIFWLGTLVFNFVKLFISLLTLPNTPVIVQGIITVIIISGMVFIALVLFGRMKGMVTPT